MAAPLLYLFITVQAIDFQNVSLIDIQNVKTVSYHTECQWQVFSLDTTSTNSDAILSKKQTPFRFFSALLKSSLNFEHFQKKCC